MTLSPRLPCWLRAAAGTLLLAGLGAPAAAQPPTVTLENATLRLEVTPALGGRVLDFGVTGRDNVLRIGEAVQSQPAPDVNPFMDNIGYLGSIVWVSPQSQWWSHQTVNPQRRAEEPEWPPDPYLIFGRNEIVYQSDNSLALSGVESPVSGVRIDKTFRLPQSNPHSAVLTAHATNIRDIPVQWDLWYNTRVDPDTHVYVPTASPDALRYHQRVDEVSAPLATTFADGLVSLDLSAPDDGKQRLHGKVFIPPSDGWIAAFTEEQLFIIEFDRQPESAIHPEQGQVELYLDYTVGQPEKGLMELEFHGPYRELEPGETMSLDATWRAFPYDGDDTPASHRAFLEKIQLIQ